MKSCDIVMNRLIFTMKYDRFEVLAEHEARLEQWLYDTMLAIDSNEPPIMYDFWNEQNRMLGFLEAIELMCEPEEYAKAKQQYDNMSEQVEKLVTLAEPKGIL